MSSGPPSPIPTVPASQHRPTRPRHRVQPSSPPPAFLTERYGKKAGNPGGGTPTAASWRGSSSGDSQAYQKMFPGKILSFRESLCGQHQSVVQQAKAGMYVMRRIIIFLNKMHRIFDTFSSELRKTAEYEKMKIRSKGQGDGMQLCFEGWCHYFDQIAEMGDGYAKFNDKVAQTITQRLEEFQALARDQANLNAATFNEQQEAYNRAKVSVNKARLATAASLRNLDERIRKHLESKNDADKLDPSGKGKKKNKVSKWFHGDTAKALDKARETAYRNCKNYQLEIDRANLIHEAFYTEQLPAALEQMQALDESRVGQLNRALVTFVSNQSEFIEQSRQMNEGAKKITETLSTDKDIQNWIRKQLWEHGQPFPQPPFHYDVAYSPEELTEANFRPETSLFNCTLEDVLAVQRGQLPFLKSDGNEEAPPNPADMPLILVTLCDAVERSGGLKEEGIFRISTTREHLEDLRKQLERGDYTLQVKDPHTPAALLKAWLRDLSVPLIPYEYYQACIELGGEDPANAEKIFDILAQLPLLNRRVIAFLLMFLRKVCAPENSAVNRMTANNLGIVFSPGFLRDEEEDPSPMKQLQDSKHAVKFVEYIIEGAEWFFEMEIESGWTDPSNFALPGAANVSRSVSRNEMSANSASDRSSRSNTNEMPPPPPPNRRSQNPSSAANPGGVAQGRGPPPPGSPHQRQSHRVSLSSDADHSHPRAGGSVGGSEEIPPNSPYASAISRLKPVHQSRPPPPSSPGKSHPAGPPPPPLRFGSPVAGGGGGGVSGGGGGPPRSSPVVVQRRASMSAAMLGRDRRPLGGGGGRFGGRPIGSPGSPGSAHRRLEVHHEAPPRLHQIPPPPPRRQEDSGGNSGGEAGAPGSVPSSPRIPRRGPPPPPPPR